MEPVTTIAMIGGLIELGNNLMEKFPEYKEKVEKDFNKCVLQFENYKLLPKERRVSTYLFKLKLELINHLISSKDYIK